LKKIEEPSDFNALNIYGTSALLPTIQHVVLKRLFQ
jgi:hypothetical protein